jgi:hypothetical protein
MAAARDRQRRIMKFDKNGFLKTGKEGMGPGEFDVITPWLSIRRQAVSR